MLWLKCNVTWESIWPRFKLYVVDRGSTLPMNPWARSQQKLPFSCIGTSPSQWKSQERFWCWWWWCLKGSSQLWPVEGTLSKWKSNRGCRKLHFSCNLSFCNIHQKSNHTRCKYIFLSHIGNYDNQTSADQQSPRVLSTIFLPSSRCSDWK